MSEHYWPSVPKDSIAYHPRINTLLSSYLDAYAVLKKPRKLHVADSLGQVEVELIFAEGVERSFVVTPMQVRGLLFSAKYDASLELKCVPFENPERFSVLGLFY